MDQDPYESLVASQAGIPDGIDEHPEPEHKSQQSDKAVNHKVPIF